MLELLLRLVNHLRPREGWAPLLLFLIALLCPAAALFDSSDQMGALRLVAVTILAAAAGLALARSRIGARTGAVAGGLVGVIVALVTAGQLLPPLEILWPEINEAAGWLLRLRQGMVNQPLPLSETADFAWQQANTLGTRLWWWWQTLSSGTPARDTIAVQILTAFLVWAAGLFAAWMVYRRRSPMIGLLPSGLAVILAAFFRGGLASFYLFVYLFCTLWLVAANHLWTNRERWERTGVDHPDSLGTELVLTLSPWIILVVVLGAFFPSLYIPRLRDGFWEAMEEPWLGVERVAEQFFGPIESAYPTQTSAAAGTGFPRSHLLGSGPELGEAIVMYVTTNDPPPPLPETGEEEQPPASRPARYWRGDTYDTYDGLGWSNGPLQARSLSSSQPLVPYPEPGQDLIQQFEIVAPQGNVVYAANAPLRLDRPVMAWWRTPGDLAQLTGAGQGYTAISRVPEPTTAELRASSAITSPLPSGIAGRYLDLPETVPLRVLDLARQVAGDLPTRYDRARAIEVYLRAYTYNLDLPELPSERDRVDYFLFDLQQGYCDYYASSMVVMARAVGVPARLASGYTQGSYDHDHSRWIITEMDGHSWVEVYFEGIGWVEFEPTAGRPALDRPGGESAAEIAVPPLPARTQRWWQRIPWALAGLLGLVVGLAALVVWIWRPRPEGSLPPAELVRDRYSRLLRWGTRFKQPLRDGQTAHEYGQTLGSWLRARGQKARWPRVRRAGAEAPAEVERLAETFVQAQYGQAPLDERASWQTRDLWARLRRHLRWLWIGRQ